MGIVSGFGAVTTVVTSAKVAELRAIATKRKISISKMVAGWLEAGAGPVLDRVGKPQKVRAIKDELMVSIPMEFVRIAGIKKGDTIVVSYSNNALLISRNK